jgi:Zn-finger nucleic acid-binding protein
MNRVNYGHRSGVIIDQCAKHGIWVDSGEIMHLMEWKKAGGDLLHAKEKAKEKIKKKTSKPSHSYDQLDYHQQKQNIEIDLLESVADLVYRFFT